MTRIRFAAPKKRNSSIPYGWANTLAPEGDKNPERGKFFALEVINKQRGSSAARLETGNH
jgi:hypothetical protein